jgi:hypothetical protein
VKMLMMVKGSNLLLAYVGEAGEKVRQRQATISWALEMKFNVIDP